MAGRVAILFRLFLKVTNVSFTYSVFTLPPLETLKLTCLHLDTTARVRSTWSAFLGDGKIKKSLRQHVLVGNG